ncbi:MAG: RNA pyrophosphohydrolase [Woeseiaceae bacterium]|nr:RNA pyrophosphohydrolase [Woeseiaceae bacterium]
MSNDWIDDEGFRANVGIILTNDDGRLLLGGRVGAKGWQFPQGGMLRGEDPEEAMYRELEEEIGLSESDVELLGVTRDWLRYRLPDKYIRKHSKPLCIGQKQRWFMLRLAVSPEKVRFDLCDSPEFDRGRWVQYWRPVNEVIYFKRRVYARALHELGNTAYPDDIPPRPRWWPKRWRAVFDKDIRRFEAAETEES